MNSDLGTDSVCSEVIKYVISEIESEARTKLLNAIDTNLTVLNKSINCLNLRCEQFDDVKSCIKQTKDLIIIDLYSNFCTIMFLMRTKLEEMSD
jgi:hypothetical protein